jgi:cellobiose phosphorylase
VTASSKSIRAAWRMLNAGLGGIPRVREEEPPLRAELLSADQMELHGKALAATHTLSSVHGPDRLLPRLVDNEQALIAVVKALTVAVEARYRVAPAGVWLLDNFYLIEEQIGTAKRHLPGGYSRELPRLLSGPGAGLPRVYDIALEAISHGDGRVDEESLTRFIAAYQTVTALKLGELWAIPIMLRLALIENLRRVGMRIAAGREARDLAGTWADQMMEIAETDPKSLILVAADMARSDPPMTGPFVAELARRLQGQSSALALPLTWIEQRLSEASLTIEQLVQSENQQQAADQVSISNSISSLRFLGMMDWRKFVETMSGVERILLQDPPAIYCSMDFATRDCYRHVVEKIAKHSRLSEDAVARQAIELAHEQAKRRGANERCAHVGYYLVDKGLPQLERVAGMRHTLPDRVRRLGASSPLLAYLGAIALLTIVVAAVLVGVARSGGVSTALLILICVLATVCASHFAVALVNWLASLLAIPRMLPRLDFSGGIPPEYRTLVVVPTMLVGTGNIEHLVEALEVRFLANRDENLHFGLLTDFRDAAHEIGPEDEALLQLARRGIDELNEKYARGRNSTFFLFHRPRRWNAGERIWMGYERKRGKLAALNALLRGGAPDEFSLVVGDTSVLSDVKYVITLDTDTDLPRDAARQFAAVMAHPLNRARYDASRKRVCEGYGILQPRVAARLPGANRSWYARLFSSEPGIDPYTRAVSDVYQDLFDEGSFIGKGIYDVDAFERALAGQLPENRILSHDLLEGSYARAGLLSDVQLYEEPPSRYGSDVTRRYRWIRGDWQLARWVLPNIPGPASGGQRNPLSALSRWKILDNLRRSLVPLALALLLVLGWTRLEPAWFWTAAVIGIVLVPPVIAFTSGLLRRPDDMLLGQHLAAASHSAARHFAHAALTLICLPYEAFYSTDAILRTWARMLRRRRLLEWTTSADADRNGTTDALAAYRTMWAAPAVAMSTAAYLVSVRPVVVAVAAPLLCLWFAAPAIAWWISRPLARRAARLTLGQIAFLRGVSRKTWAYFERFVGPEDHHLPADNYQEHPVAVVAHRTSPTNMGFALLANLSAYDFGYIPAGELVTRTSNAFEAMQSLERYEGHFYNWYDTRSLKPLPPLYVSSVDSGNLAGHLLILRAGLLPLADQPILAAQWLDGFRDTIRILADVLHGDAKPLLGGIEALVIDAPPTLAAVKHRLEQLAQCARELHGRHAEGDDDDALWWAGALLRQCESLRDELALLAPWLALHVPTDLSSDVLSGRRIPTLRELAMLDHEFGPELRRLSEAESTLEAREQLAELDRAISMASHEARDRMASLERLVLQADDFSRIEYGFLFDEARHLLAVGYNVAERRRDAAYYDLLASEARYTVFVGIAQGKLPQESWFALGRLLTAQEGAPVLLSWSGSMFEYLMPLLVMPTYEDTLLDQSCRTAVARQIEYGKQRSVPWGISESAYNTVDAAANYQYRAFGVPGLGLKRGLAEDLVIAPYASALALMVAPEEACRNLERLSAAGYEGRYGYYESIDYTPSRLPHGQSSGVVRSFMAHHEGMTLLSCASLLLDHPMQRRCLSDPQFQATTLLLQERIPKAKAVYLAAPDTSAVGAHAGGLHTPVRVIASADTPWPEVQLLSNGRYQVMVTNAGGGYSRWKDLAVTRWREDATCDSWGAYCYIRDLASGEFWSAAHHPTRKRAVSYEAIFSEARVEFRRRDLDYDTHTEIVVSPEDDIELRRVRITNRSRTRRAIDITSYAEVVLAVPAADALHPAFSNLFVQTEIVRDRQAILSTRRPRSRDERPPWMLHLMVVHGAHTEEVSYETDRLRFLGRGRSVAAPQVMGDYALSGSDGSVLDPIVAIRHRITLDAEESATIDMVTGIGETRDACLALAEKYHDRHLADRVFDLSATHGWVTLRQINATESDAQVYGRLGASIIYANSALRANASVLMKNRRGQSGLWGYAISGDLPIVLLQMEDVANIDLVRQLVQAHAYWRLKGLAVDLVIWNEDRAGYRQLLQDQIMGLIAAGIEAQVIDRPGGIFVRRADQISDEDRILLQSVARAIITDRLGTLADQTNRRGPPQPRVPRLKPTRTYRAEAQLALPRVHRDLQFFNGVGGYASDGSEYVIITAPGEVTPAPWVNVLANAHFGTVISESGSAYTWSENAHEFRLTPWGNDAVSDASGEAFYIRDEESGYYWSPTPLPKRGATPYVSRHGFGYSVFEHTEEGIASELGVYVALDAAVKFSVLKIRNEWDRVRPVSATGYVEWVLGDLRERSAMHVVTEIDPVGGALYARNEYNNDFSGYTAFFDVDDAARTVTGDRSEFIGRNGTLARPAAMMRTHLSNRVGAGLDPCAAMQVAIDLDPGEERVIIFRLGAGKARIADAAKLVGRSRGSAAAREVLAAVREYWKDTLAKVRLETPDAALNVLANGWLLYQTLACRLWARSGYYQSGGAFGFRDQLQDVMALVHAKPTLAREQLLLCAGRQFQEGDVQHWWHPPTGRGVRTHCSDDFLWLPLATCRYVTATGDAAVLDEAVHFLEGRPVNPEDDSYYDLPRRSETAASLYEHCVRAIAHGLRFGKHGLPLMGSGDWNDGMNMVGAQGEGESVWLGFFLYEVLMRFTELARARGDTAFSERCRTEAARLRNSIEQEAWDGAWYRRAYFDDGSPLGSASNAECQIDSISQSWSVLSGAADITRSRMAMDAVDERLVRRDHALVQLLEPPFDSSPLNPGYIKGYVPGVRENGGQYTHAAIWAAMAFAALGDRRRAWDVFSMINPVHHSSSAARIATYKVEPYVVAADVYAVAPHTGRGGWTWYTGSAGWMYRLIVESLLGLKLEADKLRVIPCLPVDWQSFKLHYRFRETLYQITVLQVHGANDAITVTVDGVEQQEDSIPLVDDRLQHAVEVRTCRPQS